MTEIILPPIAMDTIMEYQRRWPEAAPIIWIGTLDTKDESALARLMRRALRRGRPLTRKESWRWGIPDGAVS